MHIIFALCQPDIREMSCIMSFHFCWHSLLEQELNVLILAMRKSCCLSFILKLLSDLKNIESPYIQKLMKWCKVHRLNDFVD